MSIRISEVDLQKIHHKAELAKLSLTDYVTRCCLGKQITVIEGLDEVVRQQKAIGRNLNQLTTLANMGRINSVYLKDISEEYAQVSNHTQRLMGRSTIPDSAEKGAECSGSTGRAHPPV